METAVIVLSVYFFIIGACFGSFLNMLVYRVHHGLNLFGRSFCDKSHKPLHPVDLIPIVSYVIFKGRCRDCGTKLPLIYPLIETLSGVLSVLCLFKALTVISDPYNVLAIIPVWALLFSLVLIFVYFGYYDFLYWEVDELSVRIALGYAIALVVINFILINSGASLPFFGQTLSHILGGVALSGVILITYIISKGGGMGAGDIYLLGISGLLLGLEGGLLAFMLTTVLGSIVGVIKALRIGKLHGVRIQFGPFIALGTIIVLLLKDQLLNFFFLHPF